MYSLNPTSVLTKHSIVNPKRIVVNPATLEKRIVWSFAIAYEYTQL